MLQQGAGTNRSFGKVFSSYRNDPIEEVYVQFFAKGCQPDVKTETFVVELIRRQQCLFIRVAAFKADSSTSLILNRI